MSAFVPRSLIVRGENFYGGILNDYAFVTVFVLVQDHYVMGLRDQAAGEAAGA